MKVIVILQILSIIMVCMVLVKSIAEMRGSPELYEGVSYDNGRQLVLRVTYIGNEAERKDKKRKKIMVHDQLKLVKGTHYYLGNGFFNLFYPDYIRIKKAYFPNPLELLIGVREDGIEISVLKGEIETSFRKEPYRTNKKTWIFIPRKDYFESNGYRFWIE